MTNLFIEVTQVGVTSGGALSPRKRTIGTAHIVSIAAGAHDTTVIELTTSEKLSVRETYEEIRKLIGA